MTTTYGQAVRLRGRKEQGWQLGFGREVAVATGQRLQQ